METLPALPSLPESSVEMLIAQAIDKAVPVETLERLLAMRKELKAEYAQEQFYTAMSQFQAECPIIKKSKAVTTKAGIVGYRYAPIDNIISQVRPLLQQHGFSYSIETETYDSSVKAICTVRHILGHTESSSITVPVGDGTALMSQTQIVAAALTFAKRYAFCNAFGILTGDEDTDAQRQQAIPLQLITEGQINEILRLSLIANLSPYSLVQQRYKKDTLKELTIGEGNHFINSVKKYIDRLQGAQSDIADGTSQ